jgi:four helix bundle protein
MSLEKRQNMKDNKRDIKERSFEFAVKIIDFIQRLPKNNAGYKIGSQLLDAGTSIGANVEEATGGFSKKDFTYKMGVALKEARESNYWLRLIKVSELATGDELNYLTRESEELRKILTSIVKTSKGNKLV